MPLRKLLEDLFAIKTDFARDGTHDRSTIDAVRQVCEPISLEQFYRTHGEFRGLGDLPMREALLFAGLAKPRRRIAYAASGSINRAWGV